ncbi:hypothetical protein NFX39_03025 [Fructobacillus sp. W13]|uniref:Uncharacterized protein n=1 Tax=Fructobacillus apis TaxID=2935017 RepID=A0ABT0ZPZ6_9LACO|nr:hypothetical protein [Fructobacillus apis]MCO0832064.1 hypothetical protein [Fructobacillus apis]
MMDSMDVADDYQQVKDQVAILNARGEKVTEDQVIKRTLKRGLEEILDYRMDGTFYTVQWDDEGNFELFDVYKEKAGTIKPIKDSLIEDFKADDQGVWDHFNVSIMSMVAR